MRTNLARTLAAGVGAAALTATFALAAVTPASADQDSPAQDELGLPAPDAGDEAWEAWAAQARAELESADLAAIVEAKGCELVELEIVGEVDAARNATLGAPADLVTYRAEMVEDCDNPTAEARAVEAGADGLTAGTDAAATAIGSGTQCRTTNGPGTICVYKSYGLIYNSWQYRGSGTVNGFLRTYKIPTSASSCYRGSTWLTGPSTYWSSGMSRSIALTRAGYSGYSAHIWKKVTFGHTDWGRACSKL